MIVKERYFIKTIDSKGMLEDPVDDRGGDIFMSVFGYDSEQQAIEDIKRRVAYNEFSMNVVIIKSVYVSRGSR